MIKFILGMLVMLITVSMVNCSGKPIKQSSGLQVIQHGSPSTQVIKEEKDPCEN